jgi:hypothetical protein
MPTVGYTLQVKQVRAGAGAFATVTLTFQETGSAARSGQVIAQYKGDDPDFAAASALALNAPATFTY